MRVLLCNVRRKTSKPIPRFPNQHFISHCSYCSRSTAHQEKPLPSAQVSGNMVERLPWMSTNKGERHFHQTHNLASASNKHLLIQHGRASWCQTRIQAPDGFLRILPLLTGFNCWILIFGTLGWILLHLVCVSHWPTIFHPGEEKATARERPSPQSPSHKFWGGQCHVLQCLACPKTFTT